MVKNTPDYFTGHQMFVLFKDFRRRTKPELNGNLRHFLAYEKQYEIGFLLLTLSENALSLELIPITGMW